MCCAIWKIPGFIRYKENLPGKLTFVCFEGIAREYSLIVGLLIIFPAWDFPELMKTRWRTLHLVPVLQILYMGASPVARTKADLEGGHGRYVRPNFGYFLIF